MAKFIQICAISIVLLLIFNEASCYKAKKEGKRNKELKNKGKNEEFFAEESMGRYGKSQRNQHHRQPRSVKEMKVKANIDVPTEEDLQYVVSKQKSSSKRQKPNIEEVDERMNLRRSEFSCGRNVEKNLEEKRSARGSCRSATEPSVCDRCGADRKPKIRKLKQVYLNVEGMDAEEETRPQTVLKKVYGNKKNLKDKKVQSFYIVEDSEEGEMESGAESKYPLKQVKNSMSKVIMESAEESEAENGTDRVYAFEEAVEDAGFESNTTEEEYDEFF